MTWSLETSHGNESAKIRWEIVPYTSGRGLDVGCGRIKPFDHFIGVDNCHHVAFGHVIKPDVKIETAEKLDMFSDRSMDFVFSSHLLEHIPFESVEKTLREWFRVIKNGGYLVLYLPDEDEYPKVGEEGANPDHKWNVSYQKIMDVMVDVGFWDLVDYQKRNQEDEYSLFFVFKKTTKGHHRSYLKEKPKKTCAVIRYGAYGDLIQASSVFAGLKKQGYHVTLYTSKPGSDVILHDPNLDKIIHQDKDQVPNHELGDFWSHIKKKYDKFVNLCETVEGSLLAMPGRTLHLWPPAARHVFMNNNYLEIQHMVAGVPHKSEVKFFPTAQEREWAKKERKKRNGPVVVWSLAGSSVHKTWPYLDSMVASIMIDFPDTTVYFVGGPEAVLLEAGWENEKRVIKTCGKWSIRESFSFLEQADLIIGPETGVLNAAANLEVPKILFLSHSTEENLSRDWVNTASIYSEKTKCPGRGDNEAPACHQMHYGWNFCQRGEKTGIAQCQEDISPEIVYNNIWAFLKKSKEAAA